MSDGESDDEAPNAPCDGANEEIRRALAVLFKRAVRVLAHGASLLAVLADIIGELR